MRARRGGFGRVVVVVLRYIFIVYQREKERERNWMLMCVWVRETSFCTREREKNERNVPPFTKHRTKKEEIIVSFSRGEMRLFRVIFFLFFPFSLFVVLFADMKNVFLLLLTSNTNHA
jgi:hypothetical protein